VTNGIAKLKSTYGKANQVRLDSFFKPSAAKVSTTTDPKNAKCAKKISATGSGIKKASGRPRK
jgi:hypothetical protein